MLKRALDVVLGTVSLIVTAPLWVIIAVLVRLESRGPIFFVKRGRDCTASHSLS